MGHIYLAPFGMVYYRARILKVEPPKDGKGKGHANVFFIDWGNSKEVPLATLKVISVNLVV